MKIASNLAKTIADLRQVEVRVERARVLMVAPGHWRQRAERTARETIGLIAKPEHERHIEPVIKTIILAAFQGEEPGFELSMRARPINVPPLDLAALSQASTPRANVGQLSTPETLPLWRAAFFANQEEAYQAILHWVQSGEKQRDARDANRTEEEIARNIYDILFGRDRSAAKDDARESLLRTDGDSPRDLAHPHLLDSVKRTAQAESLDPLTARSWLLAVLARWRIMLHTEWRAKFWEEYHGSVPTKSSL